MSGGTSYSGGTAYGGGARYGGDGGGASPGGGGERTAAEVHATLCALVSTQAAKHSAWAEYLLDPATGAFFEARLSGDGVANKKRKKKPEDDAAESESEISLRVAFLDGSTLDVSVPRRGLVSDVKRKLQVNPLAVELFVAGSEYMLPDGERLDTVGVVDGTVLFMLDRPPAPPGLLSLTAGQPKFGPQAIVLDLPEVVRIGRSTTPGAVDRQLTGGGNLISRLHARILRTPVGWKIVDNKSLNGISGAVGPSIDSSLDCSVLFSVNGRRVLEQVLSHGDLVGFGGSRDTAIGGCTTAPLDLVMRYTFTTEAPEPRPPMPRVVVVHAPARVSLQLQASPSSPPQPVRQAPERPHPHAREGAQPDATVTLDMNDFCCSICKELFVDPAVLPCSHGFWYAAPLKHKRRRAFVRVCMYSRRALCLLPGPVWCSFVCAKTKLQQKCHCPVCGAREVDGGKLTR
jgi:hypothetical protein